MEDTLVKLTEDEVREQSQNEVRTLVSTEVKAKAYYNALAANAVEQYLAERCLLKSKPVNLHSSARMLVDFEIADVQLPNLHIDVRAVFDENEIFIPKKHFEVKFLPDIYIVMLLDEDLRNGTLLGFIRPSQINMQNQNEDYYFVNKSILSPISELANLILSTPEKSPYILSENAEFGLEKLIMQYMDSDIDNVKLEKLLEYLQNSATAREKLIEFENFERLSYMALKEFKDLNLENNDFSKYIRALVTTDEFAQFEGDFIVPLSSERDTSGGLFIDDEVTSVESDVHRADNLDAGMSEFPDLLEEAENTDGSKVVDEGTEELDVRAFENSVFAGEVADLSTDEVLQINENSSDTEQNTQEVLDETVKSVGDVGNSEVVETLEAFDEFDMFNERDEFDMSDEMSLPQDTAPVEADAEVADSAELSGEVEESVLDGVDLSAVAEEQIAEVVQDVENSPDKEASISDISVSENISEENLSVEEISEFPDLTEDVVNLEAEVEESVSADISALTEPLSGEDLEFQFDSLENSDGSLEILEDGLGDIDFNANAEVEPEQEKQSEAEELNVTEVLHSDNSDLSDETLIGLSEEVMIDENTHLPEVDVSASEELVVESEEVLSPIEQNDINKNQDENSEDSNILDTLTDFVETVTDEDVDNAIAQQPENVAKEPAEDYEIVQDSDISLEELLAMENDLSNGKEDVERDSQKIASPDASEMDIPIYDSDEDVSTENIDKSTNIREDVEDADLSFLEETDAQDGLPSETSEIDEMFSQGETEGDNDFAFALDSKRTGGKNNILLPVAALVTVLGIAGAGAWYFLFNGKTASNNAGVVDNTAASTVQDIQDVVPTAADSGISADIQLSDETSNSTSQTQNPPAVLPSEKPPVAEANAKPEPLTLQKIKKDFSQPNTYLSVSKIVWDVPEYLTYNDDFSEYLQTLGSTLKLNLSGDLLLINENTIFDKVKVKIQLKESGKKYSAEIADSCGTKSVDDLVLQSVKNTLNLLKPPVNSLDTADEDLYITIYL